MNKKAIITLVLSIGMMAFLSGCATFDSFREAFFPGEKSGEETVRIGVLEPQSGDDKEFGKLEIEGIELAHELYGEVNGKKIELIYADTQSNMHSVDSAVTDLISKNPAVILGSYGDAVTLEASSLLRPAKIPAIGITTINPLITGGNDYYFKVAFAEESQGRALADFIYNELKFDSVGIIRVKDEDITSEMVTQFTRRMTKLTGNEGCIGVNIALDPANKNYTESLEKVKKSGVKAVFVPTSLKVAERIFETADKLNIDDVLFIGPHSWHNEKLIKLQQKYPKMNIAVLTDVLSEKKTDAAGESTKRHELFIEKYHEKYGEVDPPRETALAFDAYVLAVKAIEKAGGNDHEKIREALAGTKSFQGVTGSISFNKRGEPHKQVTVDHVKDGKFVSIYSVKQKAITREEAKETLKEEKDKVLTNEDKEGEN